MSALSPNTEAVGAFLQFLARYGQRLGTPRFQGVGTAGGASPERPQDASGPTPPKEKLPAAESSSPRARGTLCSGGVAARPVQKAVASQSGSWSIRCRARFRIPPSRQRRP
jgi:hypothetical protein